MSEGPAYDLQHAVRGALGASDVLTAIVGTKIYDRIPKEASPPYVHLGEHQEIDDGAPIDGDGGIYEGAEHFLTLHAYSRTVGSVEAKQMAEAIKKALNNVDLTLTDHHLVNLSHHTTSTFTESDGLTTHAVVVFNAATEPLP